MSKISHILQLLKILFGKTKKYYKHNDITKE